MRKLLVGWNNPLGGEIFWKAEVASTMEEAEKGLEQKVPDGSLFLTDFQSQGRGRFPQRSWVSAPGESLLFTIFLDFKKRAFKPQILPLLGGLAIQESLESLYPSVTAQIKWPNDVLVGNRKISGILCQSSRGSLLMGIGVNCNQSTFPPSLAGSATSLRRETGQLACRKSLLTSILTNLRSYLEGKKWLSSLNEKLYRREETVTLIVGPPNNHHKVVGKLLGVNQEGALLIRSAETREPQSFVSGEILFSEDL